MKGWYNPHPAAPSPSVERGRLRPGMAWLCGLFMGMVMVTAVRLTVGAEPAVGILTGSFPETPSKGEPFDLSPFLKDQGIQSVMVDGFQIQDSKSFTPARFDILILPNGSFFPLAARQSFLNYLKSGGCFISLGGYAFDHLCVREGDKWVEKKEILPEERLSGRYGTPGDTMALRPDQIPIFDPTYLFQRVRRIVTRRDQYQLERKIDLETGLEGFAATAMTGSNNPVFPVNYARWISLLDAQDRYGRSRGSALAVMFHHEGPFKGSAWAFSGITNQDYFTQKDSPLRDVLIDTIQILRRRVFLVHTACNPVYCATGTTTAVHVTAANFGSEPFTGQLYLMLSRRRVDNKEITLAPGGVQGFTWDAVNSNRLAQTGGVFHVDLVQNEKVIDSIYGGVVVAPRDESPTASVVDFRANRFVLEGRPYFLFGTNHTGEVWFSPLDNPAVWRHDLRWMRDHGLRVLRVLHFSPFAARGYEGVRQHSSLDLKVPPPARLVDETDALVHACQSEGVVLFLSLHDWLEEELADEELKAQREWNRFWASRYAKEPGIIFDIQNEPNIGLPQTPEMQVLWNEYLRKTYGTDEALKAAWKESPPEASLGAVPLNDTPDSWSNVRRLDVNLFRTEILNRWIAENAAGIKEGNPKALATVGFLPDYQSAEKLLSLEHQDFANMHYYGPVDGFPASLKLSDRRFEGKSFTLGEFGAQEAHDARVKGQEGLFVEPSVDRYITVAHEALGMGAGFILNWCLKDMPDCEFQWGLTYRQDGVDKDWAKVYRNMALFTSFLRPFDRQPEVFLLVPDSHRMGGQSSQVTDGVMNAAEWLFSEHVDFGTINEWDLAKLPKEAKLLVWPIPYCPLDETFEKVCQFMEKGGTVYFSGDIAYDRNRQRSRLERYQRLGLAPPPEHLPLDYPESAGTPAGVTASVGSGTVHFVPWPAEIYPSRLQGPLPYRAAISGASIERNQITPDDPQVHAFRAKDRRGESHVFFRMVDDKTPLEYTANLGTSTVSFSLSGRRGALFFRTPAGKWLVYEGSGELRIDGKRILRSGGGIMLCSIGMKSIFETSELVVFPVDEGDLELYEHGFQQPVVVVGEYEDRRWKTCEKFEPERTEGRLIIPIDADRAGCILILSENGREAEVVRRLTAQLRL